MRFDRGFQPSLAGIPGTDVETLPAPGILYLPLASGPFRFDNILVGEGRSVSAGDSLATDPERYSVPLLAPYAGTIRLGAMDGHIVLEPTNPADPATVRLEVPEAKTAEALVRLGVWQSIGDAHTGLVPDPAVKPAAVVVTALATEPHVPRTDVILRDRINEFVRGLDLLAGPASGAPIHVVIAGSEQGLDGLAGRLAECRGIKVHTMPARYPAGNAHLSARHAGISEHEDGPVWALDAAGVLAVAGALGEGRPALTRTISIGGPGVSKPRHVTTTAGYPLRALLSVNGNIDGLQVIAGGVMTGSLLPATARGLGSTCHALTALPLPKTREFLGFLRPGADRRSYSRCFLSTLFGSAQDPATTALGGEPRACVACGYCENACPVELLPQVLHRHLYAGLLDDAAEAGLEACVGCGLCAYVCPSKLELQREFSEAKSRLRLERAEAAAAAAGSAATA